jgi:hypothetical protein
MINKIDLKLFNHFSVVFLSITPLLPAPDINGENGGG